MEDGNDVGPLAVDWLERNAASDDWFCHVHLWDPHTPYRVPAEYGDPFAQSPIPSWYTEELWELHREAAHGPHSTYEVMGFDAEPSYLGGPDAFPRQPRTLPTFESARALFDGYDTGVLFADDWIARMLHVLAEEGVWDDTVIVISSDHGETLGELGIYADHQTADQHTNRVPMIIRWPGVTEPGSVDAGLHYQLDVAATIVELCGGTVPDVWDGESFAANFGTQEPLGSREHLVLSQAAWTVQRSVRWGDHLLITTKHDGFHLFPDELLFDVVKDPHELNDLTVARPQLVADGHRLIDQWVREALASMDHPDPMDEVLAEGGPFHCRGMLDTYVETLQASGRSEFAAALVDRHG